MTPREKAAARAVAMRKRALAKNAERKRRADLFRNHPDWFNKHPHRSKAKDRKTFEDSNPNNKVVRLRHSSMTITFTPEWKSRHAMPSRSMTVTLAAFKNPNNMVSRVVAIRKSM